MVLGQGMSTIGHQSGRSVVHRGGYHDHLNAASMMGCSRAKQVYWLLGWVQSHVVIEGWAQAESFASPADRGRTIAIVSWRARWGLRGH